MLPWVVMYEYILKVIQIVVTEINTIHKMFTNLSPINLLIIFMIFQQHFPHNS